MTWRGLFTFFFSVSLFALFGSTFITSDAGAVSDITYTLPAGSVPYNQPIFSSCDSSCLAQYEYLVISSDSYPLDSTNTPFLNLLIKFDSLKNPRNLNFSLFTSDTFIVYRLPFTSNYSDNRLLFGSMNNTVGPITFRLTESFSSCPPAPFGDFAISENGTYDVSSYATATVSVDGDVIQGDYHDDLVSINNTIMIGCAVPLVIYFFYGIYKMILGGLK